MTHLQQPVFVVPDWSDLPAHALIHAKTAARCLPCIPSTLAHLHGAAIVVLAMDDSLCREVAQRLDVVEDLPEGAFTILPQPDEQRIVVVGGDKRGVLLALHTFLNRARLDADGTLRWADGTLHERPVLPRSYYWTWDHSTNWYAVARGQQSSGCNNLYTKTPDDYLQDYQRLINHAVRSGVGGITIYGFCRDAHGGVAASQRICAYAADRGIRILPGVGTCVYGGAYYASQHPRDTTQHPLNAKTFVRAHPEAGKVNYHGECSTTFPCPSHPLTVSWLKECARWLFQTFHIGGVNLEHGDFEMCYCERCAAARIGQQQPGYYSMMTLANRPFIDEALRLQPDAWITYATYTGFVPQAATQRFEANWQDFTFEAIGAQFPSEPWLLDCEVPEFAGELNERSIAQWTLTKMVREQPVPLLAWLDDGRSSALLHSEHWSHKIVPPTKRSIGFLHQGSQWYDSGTHLGGVGARYTVQVSSIKEACLRAVEAGLEGVSIHGEVSTQCIPWTLNYLAHRFFCYHPDASLREWGRDALGPELGGVTVGERFAVLLAQAEAGACVQADLEEIEHYAQIALEAVNSSSMDADAPRYWRWLRVAAVPGQWAASQVYQLTE